MGDKKRKRSYHDHVSEILKLTNKYMDEHDGISYSGMVRVLRDIANDYECYLLCTYREWHKDEYLRLDAIEKKLKIGKKKPAAKNKEKRNDVQIKKKRLNENVK